MQMLASGSGAGISRHPQLLTGIKDVYKRQEYGNAEGEPEDDYLSLIHSGKACIGAPIYFFFELGTDRLLNRSQLVNLDEVDVYKRQALSSAYSSPLVAIKM